MKRIIRLFIYINVFIFVVMFRKPKTKVKEDNYDCIIVCGYPANNDGSISKILKSRVDKAVMLYNRGKAKKIILSGGAVKNDYCEAIVMYDYVIKHGINKEDILLEDKSISTYHNLKNCSKIIKENDLNSCMVVTNGWHIRKANHYANKFKLDYVMVKANNPKSFSLLKIIYLYLSTNLIMYVNMFKGYY